MNGSVGAGSALVLTFSLALAGCTERPTGESASAPVQVSVSYPVERDVTNYAEYTGRTESVESVQIRARVSGYLEKINFQEGMIVKEGDVLYEIDPRPYKAVLDQAKGNVDSLDARLKRQDADLKRAEKLVGTAAMSREDFDKIVGDRGETAASLVAQQAAVAQAQLNLDFTKVLAPVSGRVSRLLITRGNLVTADNTVLTTLVSLDPMWVYFDVDERTVLRVRQLIREGKAKSARDGEIPVFLGLANEEGFPHRGTINFVDNQINPKTGTLRLRGVFPNKDDVLAPGLFARVRVPIGFPHQTLLLSDRALDSDQGQKIVYIVNQDNEVVSRPVRLGALHDGLREITDGLKPRERVIVNGLQQVRPGVTVDPKLVEMPAGSGVRK
jgi:RND family efflux transporter MFP subunit